MLRLNLFKYIQNLIKDFLIGHFLICKMPIIELGSSSLVMGYHPGFWGSEVYSSPLTCSNGLNYGVTTLAKTKRPSLHSRNEAAYGKRQRLYAQAAYADARVWFISGTPWSNIAARPIWCLYVGPS